MFNFPKPPEIGDAGEKAVEAWLRENGFTGIIRDTKQPGSTDIQADGLEKILVQVKTAYIPNEPAYPSSDEIRNLKSRATRIGRVAYVAQVQIGFLMTPVKPIDWLKP